MMNIRLFKPSLGEEELNNIRDAFERSWVGLGPRVKEFEDAWSAFIGCKSSLGVNSATAALHLAVQAFRFPKGKKIMVPAITFSATAFAPVYNGLEPVFVDSDEDLVSLSVEDMERKYDPDVVAIIPVHFAGHPARMKEIIAFAKEKNLKVIEDCAHTAGGIYEGKTLGTWGDIGCFSFEEKKCMTTGDGGMMSSDDTELLEYIKPARWVGIDKDTWRRSANYTSADQDAMHWFYEISILGFKYNMNDLAASIGLAQLKKLPEMNRTRSAHIRTYLNGISGLRNITPLLPYEPEKYVYHLFGVRCKNREKLILHLKSKGIATGVHYVPLNTYPYFREWDNGCPVARRIWQDFVTIPLHSDLKPEELSYVIEALHEADKLL
jgi:perosamine synthetase